MTKQEKINELLSYFEEYYLTSKRRCSICSKDVKDETIYYIGCWDCYEIYICEECVKDMKEGK